MHRDFTLFKFYLLKDEVCNKYLLISSENVQFLILMQFKRNQL